MLIDVFAKGITGKAAEKALEHAGITVNKNTIPFDQNPPLVASGIRVGTPALTTRGMGESEMQTIATWIADTLKDPENNSNLENIKTEVQKLCKRFPLYTKRLTTYEQANK